MLATILPLIAQAAGSGLSLYGAWKGGQEAKSAGNYNARVLEYAADDAINRGNVEAADIKTKTKRLIGAQRANLAASGADVSSGTALELQVESAGMGELDALRALNNAQREASGLKSEANLARKQGRNAARAANLSMAGSLISSGTAIYGAAQGKTLPRASGPTVTRAANAAKVKSFLTGSTGAYGNYSLPTGRFK